MDSGQVNPRGISGSCLDQMDTKQPQKLQAGWSWRWETTAGGKWEKGGENVAEIGTQMDQIDQGENAGCEWAVVDKIQPTN